MKSEDFERGLEALNAAFRSSLPEKLRAIDELWGRLRAGTAQADLVRELERGLHSLAGSGHTFGVAGLSEAAAAAEAHIAATPPGALVEPEPSRRMDELLRALREAAAPR